MADDTPPTYGDERDTIMKHLEARGGNSWLIHDVLATRRMKRTHAPVPYTASAVPANWHDERSDKAHSVLNDTAPQKKVSIVGCGQVGLAIAYAMINQQISGMIALCDIDARKLEGEAMDLQHGSAFHRRVDVMASPDYEVTKSSDLVIITAGAAQRPGESRLELIGRNLKIMKNIIPNVLQHSPKATICIVSNPCDIMTAVAAKIAGPLVPPGQIFGSGTVLDSGRFCSVIAHSLNVDVSSVQGYIIGEHGDSSVPVWSSVRIGGVPFLKYGQLPSRTHTEIHKFIVQSAGKVIERKKYTNWAVGLSVSHIARIVLRDERMVIPVSTCVRGIKDVTEDVFVSIPCVVGSLGVRSIVDIPLDEEEHKSFLGSVKSVWSAQTGIWNEV